LGRSLTDYSKAIAIDSRFAVARQNRGLVRLLQGQDTEAEKDFADYLASEKEMKLALERMISEAKSLRAQRLAQPSGDYRAGGQE